jgi:hypothetical protein
MGCAVKRGGDRQKFRIDPATPAPPVENRVSFNFFHRRLRLTGVSPAADPVAIARQWQLIEASILGVLCFPVERIRRGGERPSLDDLSIAYLILPLIFDRRSRRIF